MNKFYRKNNFLFVPFFFLCFLSTPVWAVSINSSVGLTPAKDQTIIRTQVKYKRVSDDPTSLDRDTWTLSVPTTFVYGFTEKFAGMATIPYVYRKQRLNSGSDRITRKTSGLGDITLLGKYRVHTKNFPGATSRLSLLGGLELPTGRSGDSDSVGKLSRTLQIGSGSWDPILGAAYTHQSLNNEWDYNFTYQFNTEAHDFEFGDILKYNIAYQKRLLPWELPDEGLYTQVNAVLELNGEWKQKNHDESGSIADSGGNTIYLSPGFQIASKRFVAEASFQIPVFQNLNGTQVETDYVVITSLRLTF
ncbi:MAG: transporter [Candidatus Omnitrophica bacterium]|nr:transporter [Candidatus Omnitrophota bacterium]